MFRSAGQPVTSLHAKCAWHASSAYSLIFVAHAWRHRQLAVARPLLLSRLVPGV